MADEQPSPARGTTLGRYVLLDMVGEGGMGVVYAAWDAQLDRKVAIKLLNREAGSEAARQRLKREAQAMARLRHANVATVYDLGEIDGRVYVAMEFVDGPNLRQWRAAAPRTIRELLERYVAAGRGLVAAHQAGIVHRDFKPDNVVVTADDRTLVLDFGLARWLEPGRALDESLESLSTDALERASAYGSIAPELESAAPLAGSDDDGELSPADNLTVPGTILGTPAYMAPEQRQGRSVDARGDQYSFCVALWLALFGRHPFGLGANAVARARVGKLRVPARHDVPRSIVRALERGLAWNPDQRWPDMQALLEQLERRPQRRALGLIAGAGLLAALGVGLGLSLGSSPEPVAAPSCPDSDAHVAEIWRDELADALAQRWTEAGLGPASERAWPKIRARLDAWVATWKTAHAEVCAAHRIRKESSTELHDRQMACLDRQLGSLADLLELLGELRREEQLAGVDAALALPQVEGCLDRERLLDAPDHGDPQVRDELERELARLELLAALGRQQDIRERATALIDRARAAHNLDLVVRGSLQLARALIGLGDNEQAEDAALAAAELAATLTELELRGQAFVGLAEVLLIRNGHAEAEHWLRVGNALARSSGDVELQFQAAYVEARVALMIGELDRAMQANSRALELCDPDADPIDHAATIQQRALAYLVKGDAEAALREYASASAVLTRETDGTHPDLPANLYDQAVAYEQLGRLEQAQKMFERAAKLAAELVGERAPYTLLAHARAAKVQGLLGDCEGAQAALDALTPDAREVLREPASRLLQFLSMRAGLCGYSTPESLALTEEILALTIAAVGPTHVAAAISHVELGVALLQRDQLARARAELEAGLAGIDDPTVTPDVPDRVQAWWALGATALGIVELREATGEQARTRARARIERAATYLRDPSLRELADRELTQRGLEPIG